MAVDEANLTLAIVLSVIAGLATSLGGAAVLCEKVRTWSCSMCAYRELV